MGEKELKERGENKENPTTLKNFQTGASTSLGRNTKGDSFRRGESGK